MTKRFGTTESLRVNRFVSFEDDTVVKLRACHWTDMRDEAARYCKANSAGISPAVIWASDVKLVTQRLVEYGELDYCYRLSNGQAVSYLLAVIKLSKLGICQADWHGGNVMVHKAEPVQLIDFGYCEDIRNDGGMYTALWQMRKASSLITSKWKTRLASRFYIALSVSLEAAEAILTTALST